MFVCMHVLAIWALKRPLKTLIGQRLLRGRTTGMPVLEVLNLSHNNLTSMVYFSPDQALRIYIYVWIYMCPPNGMVQ